MIQKTFSIAMAILGTWLYLRFESLIGIIPIAIAVLMYRGADHGVWFYLDWTSNSDSSFGSDSDSGSDGGCD